MKKYILQINGVVVATWEDASDVMGYRAQGAKTAQERANERGGGVVWAIYEIRAERGQKIAVAGGICTPRKKGGAI